VKNTAFSHEFSNEETLFVVIESGEERVDDMDDVFLDLDQIEDTTIPTKVLQEEKASPGCKELSSHPTF